MVQGLLICFTVFLHVLGCPLCQSHWKLLHCKTILLSIHLYDVSDERCSLCSCPVFGHPGPDQPQTRWILPGRPIHSGGAVMSCDACAGGSWGFNFTVVTQGTALAYFIQRIASHVKTSLRYFEILHWYRTLSLAAMATPWPTAEKMKLS